MHQSLVLVEIENIFSNICREIDKTFCCDGELEN